MNRRGAEAIVQAALMDRGRRDIFVEGIQDKLVLEFLASNRRDTQVRVLVIDDVADIDEQQGGAKARVLKLARLAANAGADNLRFFVDRDFDAFSDISYPSNTWHTDFPDLEGCLLNPYYMCKLIRLGYLAASISPHDVLAVTNAICRQLSLLRILSSRKGLELPITDSNKARFIIHNNGDVQFDLEKYIRSVLQSARIPLRRLASILEEYETLVDEMKDIEDEHLTRGKDFFDVCRIVLRRLGVNASQLPNVLWAATEKGVLDNNDNLAQAVAFISEQNQTTE